MADNIALRYRNRDIVFEKSRSLIAVRARAGMAAAMHADVNTIARAKGPTPHQTIGAFEVFDLQATAGGLERDLDWLRSRPSVAAASHVYTIRGAAGALIVPSGHIELRFAAHVSGHEQQALIGRYRLQEIEKRGQGRYLVSVTGGSKNPLGTAAALQGEPGVLLAEPEFVDAG